MKTQQLFGSKYLLSEQDAGMVGFPHEGAGADVVLDGMDAALRIVGARARSESVLISPELYRRTPQLSSPETELAAWQRLADYLTAEPRIVFHQLAQTLIHVCNADSAGVTLQDQTESSLHLASLSVAGQLAPKHHGRVSRNSPCGLVITGERAELFRRPDRFFGSLRAYTHKFEELLVLPLHLGPGRRGAVWIGSHRPGRHFDSEDLRIVESVARFASLGIQRTQAEDQQRADDTHASAARLANELAHPTNNRLQALIKSVHLVPTLLR